VNFSITGSKAQHLPKQPVITVKSSR